jgi:small nuclear ribonucleoprotein (snRNP)-like protein
MSRRSKRSQSKCSGLSKFVALILSLTLGGNLLAQAEPPLSLKTQIAALPPGTKIDVRMKSGKSLSGRLVSTDQNGFTVAVGQAKTNDQRAISFDETDKVVAHKRTHTPVIAWIAAGAVVGVVVIVIVAIGIERHNE